MSATDYQRAVCRAIAANRIANGESYIEGGIALTFEGDKPDARSLALRWKQMLRDAEEIVDILPADHVGTCVLDADGNLLKASPAELRDLLAAGNVRYHEGCLRGAYLVIKPGT